MGRTAGKAMGVIMNSMKRKKKKMEGVEEVVGEGMVVVGEGVVVVGEGVVVVGAGVVEEWLLRVTTPTTRTS